MVDLNLLVPPGSGVHLSAAEAINDRGEMVVAGAPPGCDVLNEACQHIYALIPCDEEHPPSDSCDYRLVNADATASDQPAQTAAVRSSPSEARTRFISMIRGHRGFRMPAK